ncbi:hypothetical protein THAOC_19248 [Thalassiosira oceanica]|uniref:Uncharacterized protein n=1 Tax=Thalassiosira oceanica TaxID=159749 RepID=K0SPT7_THAOC|nr:hypothetical protein THAOC_19248 [Thalassiosira oceanica]|eukprot:EJK60407.1 hypothetical protein THAOC_19248 [Thalassiosira oceanica]
MNDKQAGGFTISDLSQQVKSDYTEQVNESKPVGSALITTSSHRYLNYNYDTNKTHLNEAPFGRTDDDNEPGSELPPHDRKRYDVSTFPSESRSFLASRSTIYLSATRAGSSRDRWTCEKEISMIMMRGRIGDLKASATIVAQVSSLVGDARATVIESGVAGRATGDPPWTGRPDADWQARTSGQPQLASS